MFSEIHCMEKWCRRLLAIKRHIVRHRQTVRIDPICSSRVYAMAINSPSMRNESIRAQNNFLSITTSTMTEFIERLVRGWCESGWVWLSVAEPGSPTTIGSRRLPSPLWMATNSTPFAAQRSSVPDAKRMWRMSWMPSLRQANRMIIRFSPSFPVKRTRKIG